MTTAPEKVWLNGNIVRLEDASISPFDRGFLFGDGVYEGIQFFSRVGVGIDLHTRRLDQSLRAIEIRGFDINQFVDICLTLIDDAGCDDAFIYFQVTRGVEVPRLHLPRPNLTPTVFAYAMPTRPLEEFTSPCALRGALLPDDRWLKCSIKCISLMANVLVAIESNQQSANEAILFRDGLVTEGAASTIFAVYDGKLITTSVDGDRQILPGVMRAMLLDVAKEAGLQIEVGQLTTDTLLNAEEVLITSSRRLLDGIVGIDDKIICDGEVGPVTSRLYNLLKIRVAADCNIDLNCE